MRRAQTLAVTGKSILPSGKSEAFHKREEGGHFRDLGLTGRPAVGCTLIDSRVNKRNYSWYALETCSVFPKPTASSFMAKKPAVQTVESVDDVARFKHGQVRRFLCSDLLPPPADSFENDSSHVSFSLWEVFSDARGWAGVSSHNCPITVPVLIALDRTLQVWLMAYFTWDPK